MEYLKRLPTWLLSALALYVAGLITYAVIDGREVSLLPPSIGEKPVSPDGDKAAQRKIAELENEIASLEKQLVDNQPASTQDLIRLFPQPLRKTTLEDTAGEVSAHFQTWENQKTEIADLERKVGLIEDLQSDFLFRILSFHNEALCYGDSLNFTYIERNPETKQCTEKEELARRFLGFLAEIEFFTGSVVKDPELAKTQLKNYQQSKSFGTTGWYSNDVFKWIVIDYYEKT